MTDDQPLNREQRRAARFRPNAGQPDPHAVAGAVDEAGPDEAGADAAVADEAAGIGGDDAKAMARGGGGDVTRTTGAGAGGATETGDRMPHHEGVHSGNQPNS